MRRMRRMCLERVTGRLVVVVVVVVVVVLLEAFSQSTKQGGTRIAYSYSSDRSAMTTTTANQ
jgi:hypothetical protein